MSFSSSHLTSERLYELMPAIHRLRDADQGYPLRDLIELMAREGRVVEADIAALHENWFVESCADWVVPYIGDLLAIVPLADTGFSPRAEVANTIGYRRRKGTAALLEQLARDVTGWPARVVEHFERLATTQYLNHTRPHNLSWTGLGDANALELLTRPSDGPFESATHTAEVRRIGPRRGRYNIHEVAIHLFRLGAYPLTRVHARALDGSGRRFTFSPLGNDAPLFNQPRGEADPATIAAELNVPVPIRRRALHRALHGATGDYYGAEASIRVWLDGTEVELDPIVACHLEDWARQPEAGQVGIDPALGRLALPEGESAEVAEVSFSYGFPANLGGGPYRREESFTRIEGELTLQVGGTVEPGDPPPLDTVDEAVTEWRNAGRPSAVIAIHDSRTYRETLTLSIPDDVRLELRAADGERPLLELEGELDVTGGEASTFEINGLLVAGIDGGGALRVGGSLDRLTLRHCTLVPGLGFAAPAGPLPVGEGPPPFEPSAPGAPSLIVESAQAEVLIERSILGAIESASEAEFEIRDSILDAGDPASSAYGGVSGEPFGGPVVISAVTVVGTLDTRQMTLGENSIFLGVVTAERRQQGCVRFSFVLPQSRVPRRYRCQPVIPAGSSADETARLTDRVRPVFTSLTYGHPAYGQLDRRTAGVIERGAEDGSEMGAYFSLKTPQRLDNLDRRLGEYLRAGLEAGIFCST